MGTQRRSLINSATNELIARPTTKPESKSASAPQSLPQRRTALFFMPVNRNSHFVPNLSRRPKHGRHAHARIPPTHPFIPLNVAPGMARRVPALIRGGCVRLFRGAPRIPASSIYPPAFPSRSSTPLSTPQPPRRAFIRVSKLRASRKTAFVRKRKPRPAVPRRSIWPLREGRRAPARGMRACACVSACEGSVLRTSASENEREGKARQVSANVARSQETAACLISFSAESAPRWMSGFRRQEVRNGRTRGSADNRPPGNYLADNYSACYT